ncbi:MAG: hypothetical protein II897_04180 [Clostridia bacterium]|nr:hypothetical protein [Clostridia bacterium]
MMNNEAVSTKMREAYTALSDMIAGMFMNGTDMEDDVIKAASLTMKKIAERLHIDEIDAE